MIHDSREVMKICGIQGVIKVIRPKCQVGKQHRVGEIKKKKTSFSGIGEARIIQ